MTQQVFGDIVDWYVTLRVIRAAESMFQARQTSPRYLHPQTQRRQ